MKIVALSSNGVAGLSTAAALKPTRLAGAQNTARCAALISGLSQLIVLVTKKLPDGAIWAIVRSSMNMNSMYGWSARSISYSANSPAT